jgi:hypothetical protein
VIKSCNSPSSIVSIFGLTTCAENELAPAAIADEASQVSARDVLDEAPASQVTLPGAGRFALTPQSTSGVSVQAPNTTDKQANAAISLRLNFIKKFFYWLIQIKYNKNQGKAKSLSLILVIPILNSARTPSECLNQTLAEVYVSNCNTNVKLFLQTAKHFNKNLSLFTIFTIF